MGWRKAKRAAGEAIEAAGEVADAHQRLGAWFAGLAGIGAAVLLWIAPGTIGEEIPIHRELAIGFGAFGVITLAALGLKGSAGYRARSLLVAMIAAVVAVFLGWAGRATVLDLWALHEEGEYRTVEVTGTTVTRNPYDKSVTRRTQVSVDGQRVSVSLDRLYSRGERVEVLVAPSRPRAILPASVEQAWMPLIDERIGRWPAIIGLLIFVCCALAVPFKLLDVLTGPPEGVDPNDPYA